MMIAATTIGVGMSAMVPAGDLRIGLRRRRVLTAVRGRPRHRHRRDAAADADLDGAVAVGEIGLEPDAILAASKSTPSTSSPSATTIAAFSRLMSPSVSEAITDRADVPVLVIRIPKPDRGVDCERHGRHARRRERSADRRHRLRVPRPATVRPRPRAQPRAPARDRRHPAGRPRSSRCPSPASRPSRNPATSTWSPTSCSVDARRPARALAGAGRPAARLGRRHPRHRGCRVDARSIARDMVVAAVLSIVIVAAHRTLRGGRLAAFDLFDTSRPPPVFPAARIAIPGAALITASPHLVRPARRVGRWLLAVGSLATIAIGSAALPASSPAC